MRVISASLGELLMATVPHEAIGMQAANKASPRTRFFVFANDFWGFMSESLPTKPRLLVARFVTFSYKFRIFLKKIIPQLA
jgi:hypothetical protein